MSNDIVDKFSSHLKNVLTRALCFVVESEEQVIEPEHLLWALGTQKGCLGSELLSKAAVKPEHLRKLVAEKKPVGAASPDQSGDLTLHLSERAKRALEKAVLTANIYGHRYVGTEHLLSGMLQTSDAPIESFFETHKLDLKELRSQLAVVLKSTSRFPDLAESISSPKSDLSIPEKEESVPIPAASPKKTPALDYFGKDLTAEGVQADIDPVIGREKEIERVMEILCRRTKNNPLLVGDPGVGKTAIVEGLAKRIAAGQVPVPLQHKRLIALDLPLVIAGTMYRGEFEGRIRQIIDEAKANPHIILFVDEIHTMVGAGAATGSLDAANILKPALARGEIRCIGATTPEEFKKHIETDSALERRFQSVPVAEPTPEKALQILQGVAPYFETFHGVRLSPSALETAVELSQRHIPHKQLPDKAIDLIDEAAASARVRADAPGPAEARSQLERELRQLQESKRQAVVEERFDEAIALKQQEDTLKQALADLAATPGAPSLTITEREIAGVISRMLDIPLEDLLSESQHRLATLTAKLSEHIIGQDEAVAAVAGAIIRAKTGLGHPHKPLASLLFLGPSGVGKTELAKALTNVVFQDAKALIRLDMSEYAEGFTISKLIGAPAGYVGYRESSKLTDQIKQRPYSVVLFDEIEKAHRDVQNLLLQIMEEGEISDATGRKISFRNAVVVLTSNVGLERFGKGGLGFTSSQETDQKLLQEDLMSEMKERFRPELLNRIDHIAVFKPLPRTALEEIARKQLHELAVRLEPRGVTLAIEDEIPRHIASHVDESFGARDIRRHIQTHIENPVAEKLSTQTKGTFRIRTEKSRIKVTKQRTR